MPRLHPLLPLHLRFVVCPYYLLLLLLLLLLLPPLLLQVWEQFPQLQTLPEEALPYFVAAQCLPHGSSKGDLTALAERFCRLLQVYRQCRHAFHVLSTSIEAHPSVSGVPAVLVATSTDRWPTFREMFPGIKEDILDGYGDAATLQRPGRHIAMIARCLSNRDADFTGATQNPPPAWHASRTCIHTCDPQMSRSHPRMHSGARTACAPTCLHPHPRTQKARALV